MNNFYLDFPYKLYNIKYIVYITDIELWYYLYDSVKRIRLLNNILGLVLFTMKVGLNFPTNHSLSIVFRRENHVLRRSNVAFNYVWTTAVQLSMLRVTQPARQRWDSNTAHRRHIMCTVLNIHSTSNKYIRIDTIFLLICKNKISHKKQSA